ncbi:hypothetical protein DFJ74DRAFT_701064 [Hyaloraphidium curvatum]|nr:hypothetical protein DFJ74DRAFT_701064 [Hyaloraphidium curvatum]
MSDWRSDNRGYGQQQQGYGQGGYNQESYGSFNQQSRPRRQEAAPGTKCYVGNISWNTDRDSLRQQFEQCGNVIDSVVITDRETGRSRGFGFVTFSSPQEADMAVQTLNGAQVDGRSIRVNIAQDRQ